MGPFCTERGTSSHETFKDLASTDEKIMLSGEEVGSERHKHHMKHELVMNILTDQLGLSVVFYYHLLVQFQHHCMLLLSQCSWYMVSVQ